MKNIIIIYAYFVHPCNKIFMLVSFSSILFKYSRDHYYTPYTTNIVGFKIKIIKKSDLFMNMMINMDTTSIIYILLFVLWCYMYTAIQHMYVQQ